MKRVAKVRRPRELSAPIDKHGGKEPTTKCAAKNKTNGKHNRTQQSKPRKKQQREACEREDSGLRDDEGVLSECIYNSSMHREERWQLFKKAALIPSCDCFPEKWLILHYGVC